MSEKPTREEIEAALSRDSFARTSKEDAILERAAVAYLASLDASAPGYCGGNPRCGRRLELEARVKELEEECAEEFSLAGEVECLEERIKELEGLLSRLSEEGWVVVPRAPLRQIFDPNTIIDDVCRRAWLAVIDNEKEPRPEGRG